MSDEAYEHLADLLDALPALQEKGAMLARPPAWSPRGAKRSKPRSPRTNATTPARSRSASRGSESSGKPSCNGLVK